MALSCTACGNPTLKLGANVQAQPDHVSLASPSLKRGHDGKLVAGELRQAAKRRHSAPSRATTAANRHVAFAPSPIPVNTRISNFLKYTLFGDVGNIPKLGVVDPGLGKPPEDLDLEVFHAILLHRSGSEQQAQRIMAEIMKTATAHRPLTSELQEKIYSALKVDIDQGRTTGTYETWVTAATHAQEEAEAAIRSKALADRVDAPDSSPALKHTPKVKQAAHQRPRKAKPKFTPATSALVVSSGSVGPAPLSSAPAPFVGLCMSGGQSASSGSGDSSGSSSPLPTAAQPGSLARSDDSERRKEEKVDEVAETKRKKMQLQLAEAVLIRGAAHKKEQASASSGV